MQKRPYQWNPYGTTSTSDYVNLQSTDFESWIPTGQTILSSASPRWSQQNDTYPFLSGTQLGGGQLTMRIACLGDIATQQETIKAWFSLEGFSNQRLIVTDESDSDSQWYVDARPLSVQRIDASPEYEIKLALSSPVWVAVEETTNATWAVTASGQTTDFVVNTGNLPVYPVFDISPSAARGGGYQYRRFVTTYNSTTNRTATNYPVDITGGGWDIAAMIADATTANKVGTGGISSDTDVVPYDTPTGAGLPAAGMGYITATGEQIAWTGKTGTTSGTLTGVTRGIGGTTAAAATSDATIFLSHIQADLRDLRIQVGTTLGNAVETNYWISAAATSDIPGTTDLKVWISQTYQVKVTGALSVAIGSTDTEFTSRTVGANFAESGGTVLIDNERITYTNYNRTSRRFTGLTRGALDSTAATHAANATITQIPIVYALYGDVTATAQVMDNTQKPAFSLSASTNTSWDFGDFRLTNKNSSLGGWRGSKNSKFDSAFVYSVAQDGYTSDFPTSDGLVYPLANLGVTVQNPQDFALWQLDTVFGADSVVYRNLNTYYVLANCGRFRASNDRQTWSNLLIPANTDKKWAATAGPVTFTPSVSSRFIQFLLKNVSSTVSYADGYANMDVGRVTVALTSANVPVVSFGAEVAIDYSANLTITNTSLPDQDSFSVQTAIPLNQTLRVDTFNKTVTALWDNTTRFSDFQLNTTRPEWLKLLQGTNTLSYTETGAAGVNINVTWRGRNN